MSMSVDHHGGSIDPVVARGLAKALEAGEIGVQVAAYSGEEPVVDAWAGVADRDTGRPVDGDTLFSIFSVSKPLTAIALHVQAARSFVDYDEPIATYWPEFAANGKGRATVRDALNHRLGIPQIPDGTTPDRMCNWDWMVERIAALEPLVAPGTESTYLAMTFGWIVGEIVRRTDPKGRPLGQFVQDEICGPLDIDALWLGVPEQAEHRVAPLASDIPHGWPKSRPPLRDRALPPHLELGPSLFNRSEVRRACIPGVGAIGNARSEARFYAMLANGGRLGDVRILPEALVRSFTNPRPGSDDDDPVLGGRLSLGWTGLFTGRAPFVRPFVATGENVLCHNGAGGEFGWADLDATAAAAICHNRMFPPRTTENPLAPIGDAVRAAVVTS